MGMRMGQTHFCPTQSHSFLWKSILFSLVSLDISKFVHISYWEKVHILSFLCNHFIEFSRNRNKVEKTQFPVHIWLHTFTFVSSSALFFNFFASYSFMWAYEQSSHIILSNGFETSTSNGCKLKESEKKCAIHGW